MNQAIKASKTLSSTRLTAFIGLLLLVIQSAMAGRIKGARATVEPAQRRRLKKNKVKGPKSRSCTESSKRNEVKFECKSRTGPSSKGKSTNDEVQTRGLNISAENSKDKIKYNVKTASDGIRVKIEYKQDTEEEDLQTKSETEFQIVFEHLIEYVKGDVDSESEAYDWDQDEIVQTLPLSSWSAIPGVVNDKEGVTSYFTANTSPSALNGIGFTSFNFTISRADKNEHITANSMKIDVKIVDFPWIRSDSYVALVSNVESKKKVKVAYDNQATASKGGKSKRTEEVTVSFGEDDMKSSLGFEAFGEYTWDEAAEALAPEIDILDSNTTIMVGRSGGDMEVEERKSTIEVVATSPTDNDGQIIAYSFIGDGAHSASEIYWDPQAGIGYSSAFSRQVSCFVLAMSLCGALTYSFL